jgi:hypothetical protein
VIISESDPQYLKSSTVHALRREGDTVRYLVTLIHDDDAPNVRVSVELFSIAIRDTDDHFPTSSLAVFRTEI